MRGGGLDGYFEEQGLPVGIQECLERLHRGCVDYLSLQFVPKWDSPNGEGELATARTASLLVELLGVAVKRFAGWMCEGGRHREFQETRVILNMAIRSPQIRRCVREKPKPFHEHQSELLHPFQCRGVAA